MKVKLRYHIEKPLDSKLTLILKKGKNFFARVNSKTSDLTRYPTSLILNLTKTLSPLSSFVSKPKNFLRNVFTFSPTQIFSTSKQLNSPFPPPKQTSNNLLHQKSKNKNKNKMLFYRPPTTTTEATGKFHQEKEKCD